MVFYVCYILIMLTVSLRASGRLLLNSTGGKMRVTFQNYKRFLVGDMKPKWRPKTLSGEQLTTLFNAIDDHYKLKTPMTSHDIQLSIYEMWNANVSKRFVKRLVSQRPELVQATAVPMERLRAEVSEGELEMFYAQFSELAVGVDPKKTSSMLTRLAFRAITA